MATARLLMADLDNNGGLDLIVSTPAAGRVWLSDAQGHFRLLSQPLPGRMFAVAELTGDGKLDLLGLSETGQPLRLVNQGTKDYFWLTLRPRAVPSREMGGSTTFALGGEVEVRAGLLFQKQPITGPMLHFGLGEHRTADVARILWPNGDVQAEFDAASQPGGGGPATLEGIVSLGLRLRRHRRCASSRTSSGAHRWDCASTPRIRPAC